MGVSSRLIRISVPVLGGLVGLGAMVMLFWNLDWERFWSTLARAEPGWLVLLAGTILLEQLVRAWKWRQILFELKPVSTLRLLGAILAGYGAAIIVPLGISPLVRSWLISRLERVRLISVLVTAAIERFIDGIVFAVIAGVVAIKLDVLTVGADFQLGLALGAAMSFCLFSGLLWLLFGGRDLLSRDQSRTARLVDGLAKIAGQRFAGLREAVSDGIVWPIQLHRQVGILTASVLMKVIAATHFLWAGLAVGVTLELMGYLFLLVVAGFALVLARFIRVPAGFVIGSGFALSLLGVAEEQALAMILFNHVLSVILMVGIGVTVLMRNGLKIRELAGSTRTFDIAS